tara:strand:+ start:528 stop:1103 length:576 start_codon:yes stop_codon:yes gene_type:complete
MGTIKTTNIEPIADNGTVTLGSSGDTFTVPSGVTMVNNGTQTGFGGVNTPAFQAKVSSSQSISDDTFTKIQFNTEDFDTDGVYDNSTNYRFTVPSGQAGKYAIYFAVTLDGESSSNLDSSLVEIRKNGTNIFGNEFLLLSNPLRYVPNVATFITELSVSDYIELFCRIEASDASGGRVNANSRFGAYKIIE